MVHTHTDILRVREKKDKRNRTTKYPHVGVIKHKLLKFVSIVFKA
jgi:hypothetical protein